MARNNRLNPTSSVVIKNVTYNWYQDNSVLYISVSNGDFNIDDFKVFEESKGRFSRIIINNVTTDVFNNVCKTLSHTNCDVPILINITDSEFGRNKWLGFDLLPDNVFVTNHGIDDNFLEYPHPAMDNRKFNTWCLWLNDEEFSNVAKHLAPLARAKIVSERVIAKWFYEQYTSLGIDGYSDVQKANIVYKWCCKNLKYNPNEELKVQEPSIAFTTGKCGCLGAALLMKTLLNNSYMRVNCYISEGMMGSNKHFWNEVYAKGETVYYDLVNGNQNTQKNKMKQYN